MSARPLEGVRVLDFSQVLAGPTVTRVMAEFGADVIKVEPPGGEVGRHLPWIRDGRSGYFIQQNRGKRSLCVDLKHERGRELIESLVPTVDVVVENYRPGVIARLGFGFERLQELNPRVILCSISALGQEGELAGKPGYDTVGAAYAGVAHMSGHPETGPAMPAPAIGDSMTGLCGFGAVAMALFERERTGRGRWVQTSLVDSYIQAHELNVQMVAGSRGAFHPEPAGPYSPSVVPAGIFPAAGRYLFIACVSQAEWERLCAAMGRPDLLADDRFSTNDLRARHRPELLAEIEQWLAGFATLEDAVAALERANIACAPVLTVEEALAHPHNRARRAVRSVEDPVWGRFDLPGCPIRVDGVDPDPPLVTASLGEHNAEVLAEVGLGPDAVEELRAAGVLAEARC